MSKQLSLVRLSVLISVLLLLGCAPEPPSIPPSAPLAATPRAAAPKPTATVSPADAAWEKVVAEARKQGRLTVYSFNFVGDMGLAVARSFRNRYGIDVDIVSGRGAEFIERLKTEQRMGAMQADVVEGSNIHLRNMKLSGITESVARLPRLSEKDVWATSPTFMDAEAHFLGYDVFYLAPWVNTRLVKSGEEPRSWNDLLTPPWRGAMTVGDPNISNLLYYFSVFVEQKRLEADFVKKLAGQDIVFSRGTVDSAEKLARGDVRLAMFLDSVGANMVRDGAPIRPVDMKEGVIANLHAIALIKGAPHSAAGQLFINWILGEEGQTVWSKAGSVSSVRKGVADSIPIGARLTPGNPLVLNAEAGDTVSKAFADKIYVPVFKR
ncbi:MAG: extracellular solute-binding protein [Chloroflexi bacterium]|nr:extracellular solute-binding protein [Chloroflexota bacterium]